MGLLVVFATVECMAHNVSIFFCRFKLSKQGFYLAKCYKGTCFSLRILGMEIKAEFWRPFSVPLHIHFSIGVDLFH